MMDSFPEAWSDSDCSELDEFLSKPWPDENRKSVRTNEEGWPEFEPKWCHFSSNQTSKIVSIAAMPSDEHQDDRNDIYYRGTDWNDSRDDDDDDESVLTLSSMAGATAELATSARQTTPTKPEPSPQRLLRQKLPMLLCKSERLKQASPGDKRVRFAKCSNQDNIPLDPIIEIGVDTLTTEREKRPPVGVIKAPVVLKPPRIQQTRRPPRPSPVVGKQTKSKDLLCFQDAPLEAYSGKLAPSTWIHNANLFQDKTLPSNTLDFFCRDSALIGGVPFAQQVSYSEEDTTVTSSESSGSGISSLRGGVLDDKLAQVFSLSSIDEERRDAPARHVPAREIYTPSHRESVPEYTASVNSRGDVEMTAPSQVSSRDASTPYYNHHVHSKFSHITPSGSKVADRQKWLNSAFQRPKHDLDGMPDGVVPVTKNVKGTIEKFGGRASRVNAVKQKKQELERKLAETNRGPPTIKTKWEGRPGSYKKKIVLSSYH